MKKFILWDNDGVLVDTEKYYLKANQIVLSDLGINLTVKEFKAKSLQAGTSVLEMAREKGLSDDKILELREKRDAVYEKLIFSDNLALPDAGKVLSNLHGKIRMGIVTSTKRNYFNRLHVNTGFAKYFEFVVAREDYKITKPNPEPYLIGMGQSGYKPGEIIAVEDTPRGLDSARQAGIDCIVIPNRFTKDVRFEGALKVLSSIREITLELLETL